MKQKSLFLTIAVLLGLRITTTAQTPPSYVPTDGLVGWWPFNGNANDESGNGNNGTVNGATLTEDRFGNGNAAYNFNGSEWIQMDPWNEITGNSSFSLSFWVNTTGNYDGWILSFGLSENGQGFECGNRAYGGGGAFGAQIWSYEFHPPAFTTIDNSVWCLINLVFDGNSISCFKNNEFISSQVVDYTAVNISPGILSIGKQIAFDEFFVGSLDDIAIWNRVLTTEEIAGLYYSAECTHDLSLTPENTISNLGSTVSFSAITSEVNPVYTWQTDFGQGFQNVIDYGNYSGSSTSTLTISDLQLINHNQPIRVVSTSGVCVDTSAVALISIADTCITQVIDTTYITVTDTLIINLGPTGFNSVTYSNTILMYPNPSNDQLTIDYGDYATLAGYTLKIFNGIGQEIHAANISQQQEVLPLGTWGGAGNYQVVIYNAQGVPVDTSTIVLQ